MKAQTERTPFILLIWIGFSKEEPKATRQINRHICVQWAYTVYVFFFRILPVARIIQRFAHISETVTYRDPKLDRPFVRLCKQRPAILFAERDHGWEDMLIAAFDTHINVFAVRKDAGSDFFIVFPEKNVIRRPFSILVSLLRVDSVDKVMQSFRQP